MTNIVNQVAFLRTSWEFPEETKELTVQLNRSYLEIANAINSRTIGLHPTTRPALTGEEWFIQQNKKQQSLRQVYPFSGPSPIAIDHNINVSRIQGFVKIYGTFTNGSNWYPLPYVDVTAANNQVNVIVNSTQILITGGAGAPPTITSGWVVLEWLSLP